MVSTELAWQHKAAEVRYSNRVRGEWGGSLADNSVTAIQELFSSPHFNTTCSLVETVQGSEKCNEDINVPASYYMKNSQWWQVETPVFFMFYLKDWHEPQRFLFAFLMLEPLIVQSHLLSTSSKMETSFNFTDRYRLFSRTIPANRLYIRHPRSKVLKKYFTFKSWRS